MIGRRLWLMMVALAALTGCPSSWGFGGRVYRLNEPTLSVLVVDRTTNEPTSDSLTPATDAQIVCDGCANPKVALDARGHFFVSLGTSYGAPRRIVLHVTAPHHQPIDLEIPVPPHDSQVGYSSLVIVMKPDATHAP